MSFMHLEEKKQVCGYKMRYQTDSKKQEDVKRADGGTVSKLECRVPFHNKSQTQLQTAQGYNPFLEKGFCGEPFLP